MFVPLLLLLSVFPQSSQTTLVVNGQSRATIVLPRNAADVEKQSANDLQAYIRRISGAELPIVSNGAAVQGTRILITKSPDDASLRLRASGNTVELSGQYAVYELLEQLGVRWFMPGDLGTIIPSQRTIAIRNQDTTQRAAFSTRILQAIGDGTWSRFMRLGGPDYGGHGFPCDIGNADRPDLFLPDADGKATAHLDVSKPEVVDCIAEGALASMRKNPNAKYLGMGPVDGVPTVLQRNPDWDGTDFDAMAGVPSSTDRYVRLFNLLIERLRSNGYPDVGIVFYAYSSYERPPTRWKADPKIMPLFAPIKIDRLHAIDNPLSWERAHLKDIIEGWQASGVSSGYRGYLFDLADPGLPFSMIRQVSSEFKYLKDHNIDFMRVETLPAWGYHAPSLYLAAKMMWNPNLDVQATLDDYFSKFYGPAAKPMRRHFDDLENTFARADYFTGNVYDFPHILTLEVMNNLEATLKDAESVAPGNSDFARRIAMVRLAFNFGREFLAMLASTNRCDFVQAKEQLDNVNALSGEALAHRPPIFASIAQGYIQRFWGSHVMQGYERVTDGNTFIMQLPDEWNVLLFPNSSGDQLGLWKPGLGTQSWMKLKTYSESWSDQGLRYYKGNAWYRTTIDIPKQYDNGQPIHIWFSNIDESARVWINGQELPMLATWDFDATKALRFDQPNEIAVDVTNNTLNELGTGGILGPVMLYQSGK